jgi:hypothetical protein
MTKEEYDNVVEGLQKIADAKNKVGAWTGFKKAWSDKNVKDFGLTLYDLDENNGWGN